MYYIIALPPEGRIITLIGRTLHETDKLVEYYTSLGCRVTVRRRKQEAK